MLVDLGDGIKDFVCKRDHSEAARLAISELKRQKVNIMTKVDKRTDSNALYTVLPAVPYFDYIKCPLNKWTFKVKNIRQWVEKNCECKTLNLFAGVTKLNIDEIRNDLGDHADADYQKDALQFVKEWDGEKFDTILLDPPYAYRKSMEMYNGIKASPFRQLKDELPRILKPNGIVITFGYHSNTMEKVEASGLSGLPYFLMEGLFTILSQVWRDIVGNKSIESVYTFRYTYFLFILIFS